MLTFSPFTISDVTLLASSRFSNFALIFCDNVSTAIFPPTSDAVVITGIAPIPFAIFLHSSFAPPRCPESSEITKLAWSSTVITAGSVSLLSNFPSIILTTAPSAATKICKSYLSNVFSNKIGTLSFITNKFSTFSLSRLSIFVTLCDT